MLRHLVDTNGRNVTLTNHSTSISQILAIHDPLLQFFLWAVPGHFFIYLCLFKQTLQCLQQINVKNVHPVYGAWI